VTAAAVTFVVHGHPAPQGSKRHVGNGVMLEMSKRLKPWREDVKQAALDAMTEQSLHFTEPVVLRIKFLFTRPKSHYRTGKNADLLRLDAPTWKGSTPDLSKLIRSSEDAITAAGLWKDDNLVAKVVASKEYSNTGFQGAEITIHTIMTA
jgi:Holliday junction resolvase RusA-like endonuclease